MTFIRTKENFVCENCGEEVKGNGYTNHCPSCLWSKHVDIDPGDRKSECRGRMEPTKLEWIKDEFLITHKCVKCGYEKRNKTSEGDNLNLLS
ncbi:MAG: RNHCP domain-containing protein [Parcubacteria group bacterium]